MSTHFPGKSAPTSDKLRGGYYTPQPIASFVSNWVSAAGPKSLEPSAGDGAILAHLATLGNPQAVELIDSEAQKAELNAGTSVHRGDFFEWFSPEKYGTFDGVAGNPPYIRFGNWEERYRERAFTFMRMVGLNPTKLTNAWLPFVVASVLAVRPGGRVALVLPAELLQVDYAKQIRAFLVDNCSEVTIISFAKLVFPGILQEVVVLLAEVGPGPASIRGIEVNDATQLESIKLDSTSVQAPLHETEKWTKYYLKADQITLLRSLLHDPRLDHFGNHAAVNVGVVTGRNSFFCMTESFARENGLAEHTIGLLARSATLSSTIVDLDDLSRAEDRGFNNRLLALPKDFDPTTNNALSQYIELGENEGVQKGYKCSIRDPWWSVPSTAVPDGFMLRQVSSILKVASNHCGATSTDTVHRVFAKPGVDMDRLAVATLNSATFAFSEILGRSYGGGLLEIEPREAVRLPIPNPQFVPDDVVITVNTLMRKGQAEKAIALVDELVLKEGAGLSQDEILILRQAHSRLLNRRLNRGRRN